MKKTSFGSAWASRPRPAPLFFSAAGWPAGRKSKSSSTPDYNELFSKEEVLAAGPREALPEYATDVTIGYRNPDGTKSLYVFASPIRYKNPDGQWSLIDSRIVNLRDEELRDQGYVYTIANSDVKSYFPKRRRKRPVSG